MASGMVRRRCATCRIVCCDSYFATPVIVLPPLPDCGRMKLKNWLKQLRRNEGKVIVSFGGADLWRGPDGRFELRGGSRAERQAVREWVALFRHEAAVEW